MFCVPGGRPAYVEPVMTIKLNQIKSNVQYFHQSAVKYSDLRISHALGKLSTIVLLVL